MLLLPFLTLTPISLDHRIATVEAVVRELGQKMGEELRIKPEMGDEVLFVSLKPHTGPELMALIAKAASAEWIQDNGMYLGRSASFRRTAEKSEIDALARDIERIRRSMLNPDNSIPWDAGIDRATRLIEAAKANVPHNNLKDLMANEERMNAFMPQGRLLSRVIQTIPSTELAAIPLGTTARYAERPNRFQKAFPSGARVDWYYEERKAMMNDIDALSPERKQEAIGNLPFFQTSWKGSVVPIVRISRAMPDRIEFSLRAFDNKGQLVDLGDSFLPFQSIYTGASLPGYSGWQHQSLIPGGTMEAFVDTSFDSPAEPLRPGILRSLTRDSEEPTALLLTQPMDALAKAVEKDAIIALPDETVRETCDRFAEKGDLGKFADGLAQSVSFEISGDAIVGHARRPVESAALKTNRSALRSFMRTLSSGFPRLDTVARYASAQNPNAALSLFEISVLEASGVAQLADSANGLFDLGSGGREMLRAYATFPAALRDALRHGETIPANRLPPAARSAFEAILYRRNSQLRGDQPGRSYLEPSLLGDNLLSGASLSFSDLKTQNMVGLRIPHGVQTFDTEGLGYVLERQEEGDFLLPGLGYPVVKTSKFAPGHRESFTVVLRLTKEFVYKSYLRDIAIPDGTPLVGYDQLPDAYLREAQKVYDYYRKIRKP